MIRHVAPSSTIRNSWQRAPIEGIGRECGRPSLAPPCNCRSNTPASTRAARENGGVLTSPRSHTSGLSVADTCRVYVRVDIGASGGAFYEATPEQFASILTADIAKWSKIVRESGAKVDWR